MVGFLRPGALLTATALPSLVSARPRYYLEKRDPETGLLGGANFPDPSIILYDNTYYVFGTNNGAGQNIPVTSNSDFSNAGGWTAPVDAFPSDGVPAFSNWAVSGTTWAPDVSQLTDGDGSFVMYYAAALQSNQNVHCLGVARSLNQIEGPYNDSSTSPWICPESEGGAIDANGFLDNDGTRYVVWKIDGPASANGGYCNSPSNPTSYKTSLMLTQTANDGYTQIGDATVLYDNAGQSDSFNIEAPVLVNNDGTYFLFFTSGCYNNDGYTLNYVTSTSGVRGPYGNRQVLLDSSDFGLHGPGSNDVTPTGGNMVFHSLVDDNSLDGGRQLNSATLTFSGTTVTVN